MTEERMTTCTGPLTNEVADTDTRAFIRIEDLSVSYGGGALALDRLRLTVAQEPITEKSNEIPALRPLLNKLPKGALEGSLITADALHCQQESARFITQELGADYLFGLKGNQSGILERAQTRLPKPFFFQ